MAERGPHRDARLGVHRRVPHARPALRPGVRVVGQLGAGPERREAFAERFGSRALDSMEAVCADPEVDLVVVSLPNHLHVEAVRAAAATRQGRGLHQAARAQRRPRPAEMLRLVEEAGVFNAYLENVVFTGETCACAR